jgi:hypothetical protein
LQNSAPKADEDGLKDAIACVVKDRTTHGDRRVCQVTDRWQPKQSQVGVRVMRNE